MATDLEHAAILWHVGVADLPPDDTYWVQTVLEQMLIVRRFRVFLSMHARPEQVTLIHDLAAQLEFRPAAEHHYQEGLWEIPTICWLLKSLLPQMQDSDVVAYMHTKGVTRHESRVRQYLMDHLFMRFEENVALLRHHGAKTLGCFGITGDPSRSAATGDVVEAQTGIYYCTFWLAQVDHVRRMGPLDESTRFGSETFLKFHVDTALFADRMMTRLLPGDDVKVRLEVPFRYISGTRWVRSAAYEKIEAEVAAILARNALPVVLASDHEPAEDNDSAARADPGTPAAPTPWRLHVIWASALAAVLLALVLTLVFLRRG